MEVKAKLRFLRISPRKVRQVSEFLKDLPVQEAEAKLDFINKKAAPILKKLLHSAVANAENNFNLNKENLYIKQILVNQGPAYKRYRPAAMGVAHLIMKRMSHIEMILAEKEEKTPSASVKKLKKLQKNGSKS